MFLVAGVGEMASNVEYTTVERGCRISMSKTATLTDLD